MARVCHGRSVSGCRRIHIFDVIPEMEAHPDREKLNECLARHDSPARICAPVGRRYRRSPKFWLAFTALASAHCAVFLLLSLYVDHWPILVLGSTIGAEAVAMAVVIRWAVAGTRV